VAGPEKKRRLIQKHIYVKRTGKLTGKLTGKFVGNFAVKFAGKLMIFTKNYLVYLGPVFENKIRHHFIKTPFTPTKLFTCLYALHRNNIIRRI
jgi:hypothetical protein